MKIRDSSSTLLSTRTKIEAVEKMDPDEEAAALALLLRDDFIDDLTSGGYVPVQLPMVETGDQIQSYAWPETAKQWQNHENCI